jgi:prepilin-type N-terminal cleavage/methylation domain-containing protein
MGVRGRVRRGRRRQGARGVTLIELLAVVAIIGVFVALAMPGMSGIMQDRHAAHAADEIANLFRIARTRAAATGAAHYIRAVTSGTIPAFEMRKTITALGGPTASCNTPTWTNTDSQVLTRFELGEAKSGEFYNRGIFVQPTAASGGTPATPADAEFCFTPGGMPWWKTGGVWTRPTGGSVARFTVYRVDDKGKTIGLVRTVRVSPAGLPSIEAS